MSFKYILSFKCAWGLWPTHIFIVLLYVDYLIYTKINMKMKNELKKTFDMTIFCRDLLLPRHISEQKKIISRKKCT